MFSFCKPISSKKRFIPFRKLDDKFSFTLYDKSSGVDRNEWQKISNGGELFFNIDYLALLENSSETLLQSRYIKVYFNNEIVGIIYCQIIDFNAGVFEDLLVNKDAPEKSNRLKLFEKYISNNKNETLLRLFTCGNNLISGEYGFLFSNQVDKKTQHTILLELIDLVGKEEKLGGTISAILIKDFYNHLRPKQLFTSRGFESFVVEPNLLVDVPEGISNLEEYIQLFSKKYRNRAKSIFKKSAVIQIKTLKFEDIKQQEAQLYALYENIYNKAKFKLIKLPKNYFSSTKKLFECAFNVNGYYLNDEIVAFSSSFLLADNVLEAHYIGINYNLNNEYELYQTILYNMIQSGIENNCKKINLGRTAAEIKTTVGAKAKDLICYIKPQNTVSKFIQKPFIKFLQPEQWTPRNPFKEE